MALTLIIFLPVTVCLFWLIMHSVVASKAETFPEMFCLCVACGIYLFSDACHASLVRGSSLDIWSHIIALFAGPSIIPMLIMYLQKMLRHRKRHYLTLLWVILPTMLFTAGILTHFMSFYEKVNNAFYLIIGPVFHAVLAVELAIFVIYVVTLLTYRRVLSGNIFSLIFAGKPISLARLQITILLAPLGVMVARIIISDNLYTAEPWAAVLSSLIISISLFIFALNALLGMKARVTIRDIKYLTRYNYNWKNKVAAEKSMIDDILAGAEEDTLKYVRQRLEDNLHGAIHNTNESSKDALITSRIFATGAHAHDDESLVSRFQRLMIEEELFLLPGLTLNEVCNRLRSNKTYVSKMVNNTYNMGFPELINTLRVDYSQRYLLRHPDAKQSDIAKKCGFVSASSFNNIFKMVTGMTPKVWISTIENNKK